MDLLTLKPGLLVSLSVRRSGGVTYNREDLENKTEADGAAVEKWETVKVVADPEEHKRASKVAGKCGSLIRGVCVRSAFGLLCAPDKEAALTDAIAEARGLANAFNESAKTTQISVFVMKGRIAQTDQEATAAIADEIKSLLGGMRESIRAIGDADNPELAKEVIKDLRARATEAKQLGRILDEATAKKLAAAIEEARYIATEATRRLDEEADTVAEYVKEVKFTNLAESRFAFLDVEAEDKPVESAPVETRDFDEDGQGKLPGVSADNDNEPDFKAAGAAETRTVEV